MGHDHGDIPTDIAESYISSTAESKHLHKIASEDLPGGNTRSTLHFSPYPLYIKEAEGCYVTDVDGNQYLDFFNNATSLIHGHSHEGINSAAKQAIDAGSAPGGPTRSEIDLATHLTDRIPSLDKIRFTNSGTEATLQAVRAARAYTGKNRIAKFEGIYHGTHDQAQISISPPLHLAGPPEDPNNVPDSDGIHPAIVEDTVTLPYNSVSAAKEKLDQHAAELAGVMIHPLMGTKIIPASEELIEMLDQFTSQNNVPLIFDEVVSARIAYGGAQSLYNVSPDLTAFGKIIGGGFPVGAIGGRADIMSLFDPTENTRLSHSGTFNGNPVTMAAGLEALERLSPAEVDRINTLTETIVERAEDLFASAEIPVQINRAGSLFNIYFTDQSVTDYRSKTTASGTKEKRLFHLMLDEGVRLAPSLMGAVSTPMTESEVETFSTALDNAIERM